MVSGFCKCPEKTSSAIFYERIARKTNGDVSGGLNVRLFLKKLNTKKVHHADQGDQDVGGIDSDACPVMYSDQTFIFSEYGFK